VKHRHRWLTRLYERFNYPLTVMYLVATNTFIVVYIIAKELF
jgi:hypothetical protein